MANRYLIASGDSDNPAIYDGGTLPAVDDVLRLNGFALTVVANMTLAELRCDALAPAVATNIARIVTLNDGVVLTCTTQVMGYQQPNPWNDGGREGMIRVQTGGTATVVSPLFSGAIAGANVGETLNIVGFGNTSNLSSQGSLIRGSGVVNWTGSILNSANYVYDPQDGGIVTITGNIIVQSGAGGVYPRTVNHTLTVIGDISGSRVFYDMPTTTFNPFTHYGSLVALGNSPVVRSRSLYRGTGPFINNNSYCAFVGDRLELILNGGTFLEAITTTPSTVRLYTADLLAGYPPESKVEDGTVYGPSNEFEGTLLPWDATFAQALATAQRDLQLPSILSAITAP